MQSNRVIVVGGGAAGCMAAGTAAENCAEVLLLEKNEKLCRKVMITGKGRCNVTNAVEDVQTLISHVPGNGRVLYSAFSAFLPQDAMDFFTDYGVPLKVERGNRVFPQSDRAADIADVPFEPAAAPPAVRAVRLEPLADPDVAAPLFAAPLLAEPLLADFPAGVRRTPAARRLPPFDERRDSLMAAPGPSGGA